ncbi:MAG: hypothetical protein ABW352_16675 [Polyangiales bacterium]
MLASAFARADAVYLQGGRVLEGNATVDGDKVTVELESGRMAFARSEVVRIEKSTSPLDEVDAREKKLGKDDVAGMLELAKFCRDRDLPARERTLLERVLAKLPDHTEARRRLGYVREGDAWVLRADQLRKEREAQQAKREGELERRRAKVELEEAQLRRDRAEAELRTAQTQLARERTPQPTPLTPSWYSPVVVAPASRYWNNGWSHNPPLHQQPPVTSPQGDNFINGTRSPQSYFDDAWRTAYGRPPAR